MPGVSGDHGLHSLWDDDGQGRAHQEPRAEDRGPLQRLLLQRHHDRRRPEEVGPEEHDHGHDDQLERGLHLERRKRVRDQLLQGIEETAAAAAAAAVGRLNLGHGSPARRSCRS